MTVRLVTKETIDRINGVQVYTWNTTGYGNMTIVVPDENYSIWWVGPKGGIEGQEQSLWQIVYAGQMKTAFSGTYYPYHILSKGDDLRAAVSIPNGVLMCFYELF